MANIGVPSLILILVVALIIFGPNKLPELGQAVGKTLRIFKQSANGVLDDDDDDDSDKADHSKKVKSQESESESESETKSKSVS
ncbi:twin-arginine translocase TatA/TatE family subunit [Lentibacillus cibarius]|uniref:Sec-independent protein translocase protein TatA n=1 Tax=Lentibacillus cibarius TaxID=2583219 RepID=A0A549YJB0_9BACI|nr:twin-arginine translocase TatA/TatE family subunit [Lentibacillus cibarius]TMN23188.1 twin-arginine translocase TatA/TatE family subunit [Lentibacillus cibarius]TRM11973.1 twin-arginine translocase TatA/TatE family subunit [Lentibacillus cibarius]